MADSQNQIHVKQFKDDIIHAVQQTNSRLDGTVRRKEAVKAEEFFFNKLGAVNLVEKTSRNAPTPFIDPNHTRRQMITRTFHGSIPIDRFDEDRSTISGLESDYMKALVTAAKRQKDQIIIDAATGNAFEGKDGNIISPFSSSQKIVHGSAGLTSTKLLKGLEIIKGNDVDPEEAIYCAITSKQETDLMQDEKFINSDYSKGEVLDKGIIGRWQGINFIRSERLGLDANTNRQILLYTENALGFGVARDITMKVGENAERSFTKSVYLELDIGATRIEDEKIVEIACTE